MSVENHVVSLETAKRMDELGGLKTKPIFVYWTSPDAPGGHYELVYTGEEDFTHNEFCVPAYIATEIMEELPGNIVVDEGDPKNQWIYWLGIHKLTDEYEVFYDHYDVTKQSASHENLAEALALLWCDLKEKGII